VTRIAHMDVAGAYADSLHRYFATRWSKKVLLEKFSYHLVDN